MLSSSPSCLIVGAGLSGLIAARELQDAGHRVLVVDKARGVGGRMATRRIQANDGREAIFDHGAQFFTARDERFQNLVKSWQEAGIAREWFRGQPDGSEHNDGHPRFCGTRGMTGIAKHLARDLDVHLNQQIAAIHATEEGWLAQTTADLKYLAQSLLLTPPIPQSLLLLNAGEVPIDEVRLQKLSYEPCVAVLALLDGPSAVPEPGARQVTNNIVSWIADNHRKGISSVQGAVTIHAEAEWSRQHHDDSDEEIIEALTAVMRDYLPFPLQTAQVRRWRYSKPEATHEANYFMTQVETQNHTWPLVFAGDAFAGARVEGAVLSGLTAASALINFNLRT